jgi:hypothetical protein
MYITDRSQPNLCQLSLTVALTVPPAQSSISMDVHYWSESTKPVPAISDCCPDCSGCTKFNKHGCALPELIGIEKICTSCLGLLPWLFRLHNAFKGYLYPVPYIYVQYHQAPFNPKLVALHQDSEFYKHGCSYNNIAEVRHFYRFQLPRKQLIRLRLRPQCTACRWTGI